ncbi:MAG: (E)-4-hydroxy-3-methylbut-2-enyl-diphosphate synthase [Bacteroidales bacterium]|jgi:(E)-4-hydroxy-3-methylbut-2-enyl-diphosphate synthase|nr:(E)-4-hydroxy-3-methylbut-2-enyl-diphosphate synthase [Bacteroidales bacterium]
MSKKINIGNIELGGDAPTVIQSMTNTNTNDVAATVEQCKQLADAGCEMIRITVQGRREVAAIEKIKTQFRNAGYGTPLIADVHFVAEVAELVAPIVEKVRINPGNYFESKGSFTKRMKNQDSEANIEEEGKKRSLISLIEICKKHGTAIRIGVNHGSLSTRILEKYGNTTLGMAESAMEFVRTVAASGFEKLVLSMKASNVKLMVNSTLLLVEKMHAENYDFPLHLGVTEAGNGEDGRIKSAIGIGALLLRGIGDTIRVSLTENPVNEIAVAKQILQSSGRRTFFPEYIACPSCGRTQFDIQKLLNEVKAKTSHLKGITIGVMGCVVNGPGEMADADYGLVGAGNNKVWLYKGKNVIVRDIPEANAVEELLKAIQASKF